MHRNTSMDNSVVSASLSLQNSSRLAFRERYVKKFMPMLMSMQEQGSQFTAQERSEAIKYAADWSLACTAGETSWAKALRRKVGLGNSAIEPGHGVLPATHINNTSREQKQKLKRKSFSTKTSSKASLLIHASSLLRRLRRRRLMTKKRALNHRKSYTKALDSPNDQRQQSSSNIVLTQPDNCFTDAALHQLTTFRAIIPGGDQMDVPELLQQAAHYIVSLQIQVEALESLAPKVSF